MANVKGQNYMHGAAILTVGVIIMKILGFIYKIPLGNILGDEGSGYALALDAVKAAICGAEGSAEKTALIPDITIIFILFFFKRKSFFSKIIIRQSY